MKRPEDLETWVLVVFFAAMVVLVLIAAADLGLDLYTRLS